VKPFQNRSVTRPAWSSVSPWRRTAHPAQPRRAAVSRRRSARSQRLGAETEAFTVACGVAGGRAPGCSNGQHSHHRRHGKPAMRTKRSVIIRRAVRRRGLEREDGAICTTNQATRLRILAHSHLNGRSAARARPHIPCTTPIRVRGCWPRTRGTPPSRGAFSGESRRGRRFVGANGLALPLGTNAPSIDGRCAWFGARPLGSYFTAGSTPQCTSVGTTSPGISPASTSQPRYSAALYARPSVSAKSEAE